VRVASVLGALAALLAIAAFTLYTTAPGVTDAERRVAAILRRHGAQDGGLPLPRRLAIATIAAEDERFYWHGAVDPIAIARARMGDDHAVGRSGWQHKHPAARQGALHQASRSRVGERGSDHPRGQA